MKKLLTLTAATGMLTLLSGCFSIFGHTTSNPTPGFTCALSLPDSATTVISGTPVEITIAPTGGQAPYYYDNNPTTPIQPPYQFPHVFIDPLSYPEQQDLIFTLMDSAGHTATCDLNITVESSAFAGPTPTPTGSAEPTPSPTATPTATPNPSGLACQAVIQNASPEVNQDINIVVSATGSDGNYNFSGPDLGQDPTATALDSLYEISSNQAAVDILYSAGGNKSVAFTVADDLGNTAGCTVMFYVRNPSITVSLSPSNTAVTGATLTATATLTDFVLADNPQVQFGTSESGIAVNQTGTDTATVMATDGQSHDFYLVADAYDPDTGDFAEAQNEIIFTTATPTPTPNPSSSPSPTPNPSSTPNPSPTPTGTASALSCTVAVAQETGSLYPLLPFVYYYYAISPVIPEAAQAVNPKITAFHTSAWGYTSSAQGANYYVDFFGSVPLQPAQQTVTVDIQVTDSTGRQAACSSSVTVWAY